MKISAVVLAALILTAKLCAADAPLLVDLEHSRIEAAVKATADSFVAKLTVYEATISGDFAGKRVSHASLKFHFNDVKTGNEKRDKEMRQWAQTDQFPDCTYTLDSLEPIQDGKLSARGKFILHGVTKEFIFPVTLQFNSTDTCVIAGEFPLDTRDYGLPVIKKFAVLKVNPVLTVKFHLEGRVAQK